MMKKLALVLAVSVVIMASTAAFADAGNPCGGKAMNPCGDKAATAAAMSAINPCHAKLGTVFQISDPMQRNTVTFASEAPLEDIVGTTNQISGYVVFDPAKPETGGRGRIVVPVASLNTGIPLRDEHLRSADWLDAENYPNIELYIDDVVNVKVVKGSKNFKTYSMTLVGTFSLHGKSKTIKIPAKITYLPESDLTKTKMPGNLVAGRASFEVKLKDFEIKGFDGVVGSKVNDTIALDVSFTASDNGMSGMSAGNPCNPCGKKAKAKS